MEKVVINILFVIMIGLIAIGLPVLIWHDIKDKNEFKEACENRGGHVLRGRDLEACIDPNALR